ncbi:hypothetical protein KIN20_006746 [Parelaphostrongylus tenuis]|uniref:Uncharacterized protein n=1 Tax=Parelaphostrongylus tenuis TaxID=148309 RepID=A0AAD5M291_PARTN|nr:hypothetical protein KIN20_006746 [Parelaphostrongylus tenuis]
MLFGDHLFSYSLLSSLPYASCSHSTPQMFRLEPDLSFLDSVFNDVIYFIDSQSTGALWTIHQFQINTDGYLRHLEKISLRKVWTRTPLANEYVVTLDNQRHFLYIRNRFERHLLYECSYDLLFRPNTLTTHYLNTSSRDNRVWLNGMSADQNVLIYTETDKSVPEPVTRLFALNIHSKSFGRCLVYTDYAFDVGLMKTSTLEQMKQFPLPTLEKSRRMGSSRVAGYNVTTTTKSLWSPARQSQPINRASTTTRTALKLSTIFSTSTEKTITSNEFRNDDDLDESTRSSIGEITFPNEMDEEDEEEQLESQESYDEVIGLMTTSNAEKDSPSFPNISMATDLQNQTSNSVHVTGVLWCSVFLKFYVALVVL